jgi:hypothetical protein
MAKVDNISGIEVAGFLDSEEADDVKSMLLYVLVRSTDLQLDTIYSLVFEDGRKITWH